MNETKRLVKRKEFVKALMDYHREYYTDGGFPSIFKLQQKMLDKGICPRCGTPSHYWSSGKGHFPCDKCNFNITPNELDKVLDEESPKKFILKRRLKERKRRKNK